MFNKDSLSEMMKKAQKMQEGVQKAQAELAKKETTGSAGAGLVSITLNGKYQAKKVEIDKSLLTDKEMLEDLIAAAINDTVNKIADENGGQMKDLASKLGLPADFKMPF